MSDDGATQVRSSPLGGFPGAFPHRTPRVLAEAVMARDRRLNALFEKVFLQLKEAVGREVWIRTDAQYPADDIVLGRLKSVSNSADVYLDKARSGPSGPKVSGRVDLHRRH